MRSGRVDGRRSWGHLLTVSWASPNQELMQRFVRSSDLRSPGSEWLLGLLASNLLLLLVSELTEAGGD